MKEKNLVVIKSGKDKFKLLLDAIEEADLFDLLEKKLEKSCKNRKDFIIAVKPNFMVLTSKKDLSNYTDTQLVEYLLKEFYKRGFRRLHVVESQNVLGQWYGNRSVAAVAAAAGYKCGFYEVNDLTLDTVSHQFLDILKGHRGGKIWKEADFRISFAKNKTHPAGVYTLTLKNIFGCSVLPNKYYDYHKLLEWDLVTVEIIKEFPVYFGIIDAIISSDGPFGFRGSKNPKKTDTIIVGSNLQAVDWVGALKMGINPMRSRLMKKIVEREGRPEFTVSGSLDRYPGWKKPPLFLPYFDDILEEWYTAHSFFTHCVMLPPDAEFPERNGWFYRFFRGVMGLN